MKNPAEVQGCECARFTHANVGCKGCTCRCEGCVRVVVVVRAVSVKTMSVKGVVVVVTVVV